MHARRNIKLSTLNSIECVLATISGFPCVDDGHGCIISVARSLSSYRKQATKSKTKNQKKKPPQPENHRRREKSNHFHEEQQQQPHYSSTTIEKKWVFFSTQKYVEIKSFEIHASNKKKKNYWHGAYVRTATVCVCVRARARVRIQHQCIFCGGSVHTYTQYMWRACTLQRYATECINATHTHTHTRHSLFTIVFHVASCMWCHRPKVMWQLPFIFLIPQLLFFCFFLHSVVRSNLLRLSRFDCGWDLMQQQWNNSAARQHVRTRKKQTPRFFPGFCR